MSITDVDYETRAKRARMTQARAQLHYRRQCLALGISPERVGVDAALAAMAEAEAIRSAHLPSGRLASADGKPWR